MTTALRTPVGELWMILQDRKKLARLMLIQGVSQRQLSAAIGWKAHSYMARLINGEANTVDGDAALRIAAYLKVGTDDLFLTRVSTSHARPVQKARAS